MTDAEIAELFGQVPYFMDETIQPFRPEAEKWQFRSMLSWASEASVNIMRVTGTQHPDYAGLTWRDFLDKGRRMEGNLRAFRKNPAYYTDIVRRLPGMSLIFVDGKGFVAEDGNHRTCIGRCFLYGKESPYMHGVHLTEQQTDLRMMALHARLREKLPGFCTATPLAMEVERSDGPGWASHFFEVRIRVENARRRGFHGDFGADEVEQGLLPALRNRFAARFGPYRTLFS